MDACGQRLTPTVAGCVRVLDPRAGRLVAPIPVRRVPSALAIDGVTGRVFVANSRGGSGARPVADWAPSWLRDHLSWLLAPKASDSNSTTGAVSVFDAPR